MERHPAGGALESLSNSKGSALRPLIYEDPRSQALLLQMKELAPTDATVLVTGETGTGKEVVARHLHAMSRRATRPFVAVNCGAFAEQLVESDLFGHEKGAFTGAVARREGWSESADRGTLFLDEVGELPLSLQVKLLRVLQESEVVRLGSRVPVSLDVRLIAATNVDLQEAIAKGRFREDLFYRLHVTALRLLPLRERILDIEPLARHFLTRYAHNLRLGEAFLTKAAVERLCEHLWPGNVRELENVIHRALLRCKNGRVEAADLSIDRPRDGTPMRASMPISPAGRAEDHLDDPLPRAEDGSPSSPSSSEGLRLLDAALARLFEENHPRLHQQIEASVLGAAYRHSHSSQQRTAQLLGVSRNVVRARLIEYGAIAGVVRHPKLAAPPAVQRAKAQLAAPPAVQRPDTYQGQSERSFSVGFHRFGLLMLVRASGTFEDTMRARGWRIHWKEYAAGPEVVTALCTGEVALGAVGDCPSIVAQASSVPLTYFAAEAPAPQAEAIVVHEASAIRSVRELRGCAIALHPGSNVHYLLLRALEEAGMKCQDVDLRFAAPNDVRRAFERGEVDACGLWDPHLASLQDRMAVRVLRDGTGLTENTAYYLANRTFASEQGDVLDELVGHAREALERARQNPEAFAEGTSAALGIERGALVTWLRRQPSVHPLSLALVRSQQQVADALHRHRLIGRPVRVVDAEWHRLAG